MTSPKGATSFPQSASVPLTDRSEIIWRRIHPDAGQQHTQFDILQIGRLPHHVLARQINAALCQYTNQRLRRVVAVDNAVSLRSAEAK